MKEKDEQIAFVQYGEMTGMPVIMVTNGFMIGRGINKFSYINSLKKQGLHPGFPDVFILTKSPNCPIIFFEFKRAKTGRVSPSQKDWNNWLNDNQYPAFIVYSAQEAIDITERLIRGDSND